MIKRSWPGLAALLTVLIVASGNAEVALARTQDGGVQKGGTASLTPMARRDLFTVYDVAVDVTARNATVARTLAIREGERRAFQALMDRIVAPKDKDRFDGLDQGSITDLVLGLQFANERSSQVRYIADLTVQFNTERVRALLKEGEVPFTQTPGSTLLVLPVMEYAGTRLLWEPENSWFAAWKNRDLANGLLPYVLPEGDMTDRLTLNQFQATTASDSQRQVLASNRGASGTFVPVAMVTPDLRNDGYVVIVTWAFDDLALTPEVESMTEVGTEAGAAAPVRQTFKSQPNETLEALLERAVHGTVAMRDGIWKERTLIRLDETRTVRVHVPLRGMADWGRVQDRLSAVNLVQKAELKTMASGEALMDIAFAGRPDQLVLALYQGDLVLRRDQDDLYLILSEIAEARGIKPLVDFSFPGEDEDREPLTVVPPDSLGPDSLGPDSLGPDSLGPDSLNGGGAEDRMEGARGQR
jgi:hypothetical protein